MIELKIMVLGSRCGWSAALILMLIVSAASAQIVSPGVYGKEGECATPQINDPAVLREAWLNTRTYYPGIEEAMRQWRLQKSLASPQLGDQYLFWVYNIQNRRFDTLRAELKAVGNLTYIWVALSELSNNHITMSEVTAIQKSLEVTTPLGSRDSTRGILSLGRQFFGDAPNVDSNFEKGKGDGKTHFLICDIQDGWNGSGGYVAGFFLSVDVDPNSGIQANSNRRDMVYIDSFPGIFRNGNRNLGQALPTLAHEFQHLIHWNYDRSELTFFNEGLSEYAEYLCGYGLRSSADYFLRTNVTLTSWSNTIADYSRAARWTLFLADQYGDTFMKNFTQNPASGTAGFESALAQSGLAGSFSSSVVNWFVANWIGSSPSYPTYSYQSAPSLRPTLKEEYVDPNVSRSFALPPLAVDYLAFTSGGDLRVSFTLSPQMIIKAIESGPGRLRVRDVSSSAPYTLPEFGLVFTSVVFVVAHAGTFSGLTYAYSATGVVTRFAVEEKYDDGSPRPFSQGFAPYLGFGNHSTAKGYAVRFHPAIRNNVLRKARLLVMFNQEFSNGTALPDDDRDFLFHVWGDNNGRPGQDLIPPFLVKVDREKYPIGSFVDIDLSGYSQQLRNLPNPIYVGLTEDEDDSVGTYVGVQNLVSTDYSYVYRGPNHQTAPNTWVTMKELSALNQNRLDGFNLMFRAIFEYSDSSSAPKILPGYLQHPFFTEYIKVVAASTDNLRLSSLSGKLTQPAGAVPLSFVPILGTLKAFLDTTQLLRGSGTISIQVRGAKRYGIFFSDTLIAFAAKLGRRGERVELPSVSREMTLSVPDGALDLDVVLTAFEGVADPSMELPSGPRPSRVFTLGPPGRSLNRSATVRVAALSTDPDRTLAIMKEGRWFALPTSYDQSMGEFVGSLPSLGVVALVDRKEVQGSLEILPTSFALYQNYPNPFNPSTTIPFDLPRAAHVRLTVYDILGREVAALIDEEREAGHHTVLFSGRGLTSGVYFYRLQAAEYTNVKKLVLMQ